MLADRVRRAQAVAIAPTLADADSPTLSALPAIVTRQGRVDFREFLERRWVLGHPRDDKRDYRVVSPLRLNQWRRANRQLPKRDLFPLAAPA